MSRDNYYIKKYGITLADYEAKLLAQENSCDLCKRHTSNFKFRLSVDHDHKTGQVRGLLCFFCNKYRVGRNNLVTATQIYEYMQKHKDAPSTAPVKKPKTPRKKRAKTTKRSRVLVPKDPKGSL